MVEGFAGQTLAVRLNFSTKLEENGAVEKVNVGGAIHEERAELQ